MQKVVKYFVELSYWPGIMEGKRMQPIEDVPVDGKTFKVPSDVFAWRFVSIAEVFDSEDVYKGDPKPQGPRYLKGKLLTKEHVRAMYGIDSVLYADMRRGNYDVVQVLNGPCVPFDPVTDVLVE